MSDIEHGTTKGYRVHGCRCEDCREAHRVAMADYRERAARGLTHRRKPCGVPTWWHSALRHCIRNEHCWECGQHLAGQLKLEALA